MENKSSNKILDFDIKSLGGITAGSLQVKPLTLLCGPNNTGKTWAMYAVYSFLKNIDSYQKIKLPIINELVSDLQKNGSLKLDVYEWLESNFETLIQSVNEFNKNNLSINFNASDEVFTNTRFDFKTNLENIKSDLNSTNFSFSFGYGGTSPRELIHASKKEDGSILTISLMTDAPKDIMYHSVATLIYNVMFSRYGKDAFLIPAERNGLHLFYKELSNRRTALLHHASREQFDLKSLLKDVMHSRYAKPIADYIDWLNDLNEIKKSSKKTEFHIIAEKIKKLVNGKYHIDPDGSIHFISRKKRGQSDIPKMELHLASSTVKSLFGLWFYLEYQATSNSVLMIDEPELNLHPSNQRALARLITEIVNSGVNVIVSTHSDYFVRELNSLIMLNSNSEETANQEARKTIERTRDSLMKKYSISQESLISGDKVNAYLFGDGTLGLMPINKEGIIATTFDEQINQLNDSSDEIYYEYVLGLSEDC